MRHRRKHSSQPKSFYKKNESSQILFRFIVWLGQIKQALTIYKEDIRQRLEDYNPED